MLVSILPISARASSSKCFSSRLAYTIRNSISTTSRRCNVAAELDRRINQRDIIERKKKAFEEKYGDQLQRKVAAEGVEDLDALKRKVMAPSVKAALRVQKAKESIANEPIPDRSTPPNTPTSPPRREAAAQVDGDRAGVKPLSSILNLPLLHLTPHDADAISKIWTTYHTTHPTLSSSYLSASLPFEIYDSMISLASTNPIFVLPLPRPSSPPASSSTDSSAQQVKTDEYEMFYLQWLFHPTPSSPSSSTTVPPPTTSVIFTPLEEFKKNGEWAQPQLVLTHYPDLAHSHNVVLMRGEISPEAASGPQGSLDNPGWLLSQQQAQLLALALQRFYCADVSPPAESESAKADRRKRAEALVGFREHPEKWDWEGLIQMSYGGMV